MFLEIEKKEKKSIAAIDSYGGEVTYGELCEFSQEFYEKIGKRTLLFILSENRVEAFLAYVACLSEKIVPLILDAHMEKSLLQTLLNIYEPEYVWGPEEILKTNGFTSIYEKRQYGLAKTEFSQVDLYKDLSMLLTTSGSTGSPKLVRHSYENVEANARNVAAFFEIKAEDRPIVTLPMHYTMGLSIISSHLYVGATLLLTNENIMNKKFWTFFKEYGATNFTGVPYSFELLKKLRFFQMDLPSLKVLSQGGGKLYRELQIEFVEYVERTNRKFIATYGQTECTARMAYLPSEYALEKCGSIGKAIPNGRLYLIDANETHIAEPNIVGEMVYEGPNVTMGYAECKEDLCKGDEWHGVMPTGDMARVDEDGFFYIVGRKKRFLKLYGYRVSLDECEQIIKSEFAIECACVGNDSKLVVYLVNQDIVDDVRKFLLTKLKIYASALEMRCIADIPKNEAGKILYKELSV